MTPVNPRLVRKWSHAVRSLDPPENVKQRAALKKALNLDGTFNPDSLSSLGHLLFIPAFLDASSSNASNSVWQEHVTVTSYLGPGEWNIIILNWMRGNNSSSSNVNVRHDMNGIIGDDELDRPCISGSTDSPLFLLNTYSNIPGNQEIVATNLFKSTTTGTSSVRDDMMLVIGIRQ